MITALIPARYASTRFPKKVLALIGGKPMVQRVYEQAIKAKSVDSVIVATDHAEIEQVVKSFGGRVCMTSAEHQSGTDRCAEVANKMKITSEFIINVQGDEPFIRPEQIDQLGRLLLDKKPEIGTLCRKIDDPEKVFSPNVVKLVKGVDGKALYFSRNPIPFNRDVPKEEWLNTSTYYQHIGMYGYKTAALKEITQLKPSFLEQSEKLEQLRWLENGFSVLVAETAYETVGVDTPEDLAKLLHKF